ncbi:hypothetical protein [Aliarcobacter butzleri]|uniref:hypothetical protein n=1 Tax=Aliarcobacter butzleri TaxID=28197 RepID=UPI00126A19F2|nr:hypothetical protein [Aliarcobacter butzleri]
MIKNTKNIRLHKKGEISLVGFLIYLGVFAAFMAGSIYFLSDKKDDITYKTAIDKFMQSFHEGMLKYSIDSIHANGNFANVEAKNAATFMDAAVVRLSTDKTYLTSTNPMLDNLIKVEVTAAKDANGNNNKRYKVLFDLSDFASSNGWDASNEEDKLKFTKLENEIARFFLSVSPDAIVSGSSTSLGSANSNASASDPDIDAIIVIDRVK